MSIRQYNFITLFGKKSYALHLFFLQGQSWFLWLQNMYFDYKAFVKVSAIR